MRSEPATLIALALPADCSVNTPAIRITASAISVTTPSATPTRTRIDCVQIRRRTLTQPPARRPDPFGASSLPPKQ
ncbi:MAG: hypothetical protein H6R03_1794 [Burkholderiaceae bacterium]|nr:hypothetical protein [Burkholderiaceae bacterium]